MAESSILSLRGLSRHYGTMRGVGPIDLELGPGIHGLLGPNGSGKTTLIKTLLGFLAPTSGFAHVLGIDVQNEPLEVRRRVGYMAENDVIVPGLNAVQTIRLAAELCGLSAARAHEASAEALHAVGLGDERFHAPHRLSTGQRQKVKLAAALVHAPQLLLLDEPTNGLDPGGRRTMLRLIREVSDEKGISVILSTHILPDVQAVCDDAIVLREGTLLAVEPVRAPATSGWFRIEAMGPMKPFSDACAKLKWQVRATDHGLLVKAPSAARLLEVARDSDTVLMRIMPQRAGVEEAVMEHLEANP